jgi:hypothetical protein
MLGEKYFTDLGAPSRERLSHLPRWARRYERGLRAAASWWHESRRRPPAWSFPVITEPDSARVLKLPVWAFEWLNDLRFEVYWQRSQVQSDESAGPPVRRAARSYRPIPQRELGSTVS